MLALLGTAGPAAAQFGFGDPLGLIASGGLQPFVSSGGSVSVVEFASPVDCLGGTGCTSFEFHLIFFNDACTRGVSVALPLTTNDVDVVTTLGLGSGSISGLIAFGISGNTGAELNPIPNNRPVFARAHEINIGGDYSRVIDPIGLWNPEFPGPTWNAMRTGAAFFAPPESGTFATSLYLVCPDASIQAQNTGAGGVFIVPTFPDLIPDSAASLTSGDASAAIQGVVFNDEELFINDIFLTCDCLTIRTLLSIGGPYVDLGKAPNGTYTELLGGTAPFALCSDSDVAGCSRSFAAYRAIVINAAAVGGSTIDDFGRTWMAHWQSLGGRTVGSVQTLR
jgi:hypothetical protein